MTISSIPPTTASAITPYNPLGRHTVGEENKDTKNSTLKAVEESAQAAHNLLRRHGHAKHEKVEQIKDDDARKDGERKQEQTEDDARRKGREQDVVASLQNKQQTNPRLHELNRNYMDPLNQSARPGGIVSEAV